MLPKERVVAAFEHREPDRVPTGESRIMFGFAAEVLGRPTLYQNPWGERVAEWEGRREEIVRDYSRDVVDLVRKLELDFLAVRLVPGRHEKPEQPERLGPYTWRDRAGRIWEYSPYSGTDPRLVQNVDLTVDDIAMPPDPAPVDATRLDAVERVVKELGGTHMIFGRTGGGAFPWQETVGFEEFLTRMVTQPEFVEKATEAATRRAVAWVNALCDVGVDAIWPGADVCDNRGPFMSPRLFRQFVKPAVKRVVDAAHARGKWVVWHSCGNNWPILDDLVEVGIDAWQAIQPRLVDVRLLKERYGKRLTLIGGVDDDTLVRGSTAEVVDQVRYAIKHAAPGGGFVLAASNTISNAVKRENYLAMLEANRQLGRYPILL